MYIDDNSVIGYPIGNTEVVKFHLLSHVPVLLFLNEASLEIGYSQVLIKLKRKGCSPLPGLKSNVVVGTQLEALVSGFDVDLKV